MSLIITNKIKYLFEYIAAVFSVKVNSEESHGGVP